MVNLMVLDILILEFLDIGTSLFDYLILNPIRKIEIIIRLLFYQGIV